MEHVEELQILPALTFPGAWQPGSLTSSCHQDLGGEDVKKGSGAGGVELLGGQERGQMGKNHRESCQKNR